MTPSPISNLSLAMKAGVLFVIFMGPSLGGLVPQAIAVAQPAMAAHIGDATNGTFWARMTLALASLMIIVGAPLAGLLAERVGYRKTLLISLLIYGFAGAAGMLMPERIDLNDPGGVIALSVLMATRMILGLAAGSIMAIYLALAAHYFQGEARARVLGLAVAASSVVGSQALWICGALVDWQGWRAPFMLYLLAFFVFVVAWLVIHPAKRDLSAPGANPTARSMLQAIAAFWPIYAVLMVMSIGTFVLSEGGPFLLKANGFESATTIGTILSIGYYPAIFTAASYGFVRHYLSDRWVLVSSGVLMGLGLLIAVPLTDQTMLTLAFILFGFGSGMKAPAISSILLSRAPENIRAAATGLTFSAIFAGQFLTPLILEALDRSLHIHGAFVVFGASFLVVALVVFFGALGKPQETAAQAKS
jgi:MFS family permease